MHVRFFGKKYLEFVQVYTSNNYDCKYDQKSAPFWGGEATSTWNLCSFFLNPPADFSVVKGLKYEHSGRKCKDCLQYKCEDQVVLVLPSGVVLHSI